jgi:hypothetical protein
MCVCKNVAKLSEIDYVISEFLAYSMLETRLCFYTSYSYAARGGNLANLLSQEVSFSLPEISSGTHFY